MRSGKETDGFSPAAESADENEHCSTSSSSSFSGISFSKFHFFYTSFVLRGVKIKGKITVLCDFNFPNF